MKQSRLIPPYFKKLFESFVIYSLKGYSESQNSTLFLDFSTHTEFWAHFEKRETKTFPYTITSLTSQRLLQNTAVLTK